MNKAGSSEELVDNVLALDRKLFVVDIAMLIWLGKTNDLVDLEGSQVHSL